MAKTGIIAAVLVAVLAAGCGGGATNEAQLDCQPAEGAVGATVVCRYEDIADDCTLFFGNIPVAFSTQEEGTLSFIVPPTISGQKDITVQCGAGEAKDLGKFAVLPKPGDDVPSEDAGDETVTPDGDGDSAQNHTFSAVQKLGFAKKMDLQATDLSQEVALTVESQKDEPNAKLSTYKVSFEALGNPKNVYLSGNLFNREASDATKDEDKRCGKIGEGASARYLATQADGSKLNEGSAIYEQNAPYLTGVPCGDGEECLKSGYQAASDDRNPWCKIVPQDADGETLTSGAFYTRSLAKVGTVCLAVQAQNDAWSVTCRTVSAPEVAVDNREVKVDQDRPVVTISFDYANADQEPSVMGSGCHKTNGTGIDRQGGGSFEAECPITSDERSFAVLVGGIGETNNANRIYTLELGKPEASYRIGTEPASGATGEVGLFYEVSRPYTLKSYTSMDGSGTITSRTGNCPWAAGVSFVGLYLVDGQQVLHPAYRKIEKKEDASGRMAGYKDFKSTFWSFTASRFDGTVTASEVVRSGFPFNFQVTNFAGDGLWPHFYSCVGHYRIQIAMDWTGENLDGVTATCKVVDRGHQKTTQSLLSPNSGSFAPGFLTGHWDLTIDGDTAECDFEAAYKDGSYSAKSHWVYARPGEFCD
ncbi:MAG TPA: hypothetical protein VFX30_05860 [bacterium]|nr:hypothetical protein [bacterium]